MFKNLDEGTERTRGEAADLASAEWHTHTHTLCAFEYVQRAFMAPWHGKYERCQTRCLLPLLYCVN